MYQLESERISCPYCGEKIELLIDYSIQEQEYIEDCEVCCHPISLFVSIDESGKVKVTPRQENE